MMKPQCILPAPTEFSLKNKVRNPLTGVFQSFIRYTNRLTRISWIAVMVKDTNANLRICVILFVDFCIQ